MILLDTTTRKLQIVLSAAKITNDCPWVSSYMDISTSTFGMTGAASGTGTTNGVTVVDIVASPAASTSRQLKYFSVFNADTAAITATVQYDDNATERPLVKVTLQVGETLTYTAERGWFSTDTAGDLKQAASFPAQTANYGYFGPASGSAAAATFRPAVANDIPGTLNTTTAPAFIPSSATVPVDGMFLPAANAVGLATNSLERLRIDSAGNVGIGTATPGRSLEIFSNIVQVLANFNAVASYSQIAFTSSGSTGTFPVRLGGNGNDFVMTAGGIDALRIRSSGNTLFTGAIACAHYTVATLPTGIDAYSAAFVTDSTVAIAAGLGLTPVGGGTNKVPVYTTDGTNWLIG